MLLSNQDFAICRTSMFDKNFFGLHPIIKPQPDHIYSNKLYLLCDKNLIKRNSDRSIQPSLLLLRQETLIRFAPFCFFRFQLETGEESENQVKICFQTPLIAKLGLMLGNKNGLYMQNIYEADNFKFTLNNKLYNDRTSKISLKINYDEYLFFKYSLDSNQTYNLGTGNRLSNNG